MRAFDKYPLENADPIALSSEFPTSLVTWNDKSYEYSVDQGDTAYGFVISSNRGISSFGPAMMTTYPGQFFVVPGRERIRMRERQSAGVLFVRHGFRGMFQLGGPPEEIGRLRYIDGCTDTLLVAPPRLGDPCLNLLHFPPGIDQTMHTHPSDRIGVVLSGLGECEFTDDDGRPSVSQLLPGDVFCIHANGPHRFRTDQQSMRVLAFHPDSDFGPTDENHPMINRTMVDGVSAAKLDSIRTSIDAEVQS